MCTIENNYMYNSTFNLFYAVYDTKNKKIAQNKSKCDTETIFCVLQKPITCTIVHLICFLQFMTKKNRTLKKELQYTSCVQKNI